MPLVTLLGPGVPVKGMLSVPDPAMLGKGSFADLLNMRFRDGVLTVRDGAKKLTSTLISGASFRGAWTGVLNGNLTVVAAYRLGATTRIYTYDPTTWVRTERTSGTGAAPYGATRFASDAWVVFAPVRTRKDVGLYDLLTISNGVDDPAVLNLDPSGGIHAPPTGAGFVLPHKPLLPPDAKSSAAYLGPSQWLYVKSTSGKTYTNSDPVELLLSNAGTTSTNAVRLRVGSGAVGGETSVLQWSSSDARYRTQAGESTRAYLDLSTARQVILSVKDNVASPVWEKLKIEAYSDVLGAYVPIAIWDPSGDSLQPIYIESESESTRIPNPIFAGYRTQDVGTYLVAFDLGHLTAQAANLAQVSRLRFTYAGIGMPVPVDQTADIRAILVSGNVQGGSDYKVSLYDAPSRAESAGTVLALAQGPSLSEVGASDAITTRLPLSPALYYFARLAVKLPPSAGQASHVNVYRRGPEDGEYTFVGFSGAYNIVSAAVIDGISYYTDNVADDDRDAAHVAPSDFQLTLPKARALQSQAGRLFAGGVAGALSDVYASEQGEPFRFLEAARFLEYTPGTLELDLSSANRVTFAGEEVTSIIQHPSIQAGPGTLLVFTDRAVYHLQGRDSSTMTSSAKASDHGCPYPRSIATRSGSAWYLDDSQEVRSLGSGNGAMSLGRVDQQKSAVVTNSYGEFLSERYYLTYSTPTDAPMYKSALLYDAQIDAWSRDEIAQGDYAGLLRLPDGRLLAFADTGHVYELESPGQAGDGTNTDVSIGLATGELWAEDLEKPLFVGDVVLVADRADGSTLTFTRGQAVDGGTVLGSVDLTTGSPLIWRRDGEPTTDDALGIAAGDPVGTSDLGVQVTMAGSLPAGKRIRGLGLKVEGRSAPAYDVSSI